MRVLIVLCIAIFLMGCAEAIGEPPPLPMPEREKSGIFTAYNADVAQTDDTPMITASGQRVSDGIIANNCLPFGTRIVVNRRVYEVQDRMNKRYECENFDIFMWDYQEAKEFGVQELNYRVI